MQIQCGNAHAFSRTPSKLSVGVVTTTILGMPPFQQYVVEQSGWELRVDCQLSPFTLGLYLNSIGDPICGVLYFQALFHILVATLMNQRILHVQQHA